MTTNPQATPLTRLLNAGSTILHEKVAEAYEPEWQELIRRMFAEMRKTETRELLNVK